MNWEDFCRHADRLLFRQLLLNQPGTHNRACDTTREAIGGVINGVDVDRLGETVNLIRQNPILATSRFRATNSWISGGHNRSRIHTFYAAGREDTSRSQPFVLDADEPSWLLGTNRGANPGEFVLHALAACLTTSLVYHAAARGIRVESVESTVEGDIDWRGFLGLSADVRRGFKQIRVHFTVKSNASSERLRELTTFSPVLDIVSNPVPVSVTIASRPTR